MLNTFRTDGQETATLPSIKVHLIKNETCFCLSLCDNRALIIRIANSRLTDLRPRPEAGITQNALGWADPDAGVSGQDLSFVSSWQPNPFPSVSVHI